MVKARITTVITATGMTAIRITARTAIAATGTIIGVGIISINAIRTIGTAIN